MSERTITKEEQMANRVNSYKKKIETKQREQEQEKRVDAYRAKLDSKTKQVENRVNQK